MSSLGFLRAPDEQERLAAFDPALSFIVQAPAGSGKTELLIQRYLRLLATVEKPERILAMTFTRKAAAEMRERILNALQTDAPVEPHRQLTQRLAEAAMARSRERNWDLLENPGRVKVQTIDSLCGSLVAQMPWLARHGAVPEVREDAKPLYRSAAQRAVLEVESEGKHREWIEHLLLHRDNKAGDVANLIVEMLAKREQWLAHAVRLDDSSRAEIERAFEQVRQEAFANVERMIPTHDAAAVRAAFASWGEAVEGLLTKQGTWRKNPKKDLKDLSARLATIPSLEAALHKLRTLPPPRYEDEQWKTLRSLVETLKLAAAHLRLVFQETGAIDFSEMSMAARHALGQAEDPTELALKLDARIDHLLIDEFQDTSAGQFELTEKLIEGWEPGDGRTIFLVGDPMQSIYRFRQAEVGLFLKTASSGIAAVRTAPLTLSANYRSARGVVEWVNRVFSAAFPPLNDAASGAVRYSPSHATRGEIDRAVTLHPFPEGDCEQEARRVVELVRAAEGSTAVLVRARTHLPAIVNALKTAGIPFRAVKIDALGERPSVLDLLSLTRAMLHLADRVAWLAILRAPWCGLSLADLHSLAGHHHTALIYDLIHADLSHLTEDAQLRVIKLRTAIDAAFAQRGRSGLRVWIERTWRALGGESNDAQDFFALLEQEQSAGDLPDLDAFTARVHELKARPDPHAGGSVQLMTVHESKGLEFDNVILPGLGRGARHDSQSLFLYHEGLLAPIAEKGATPDPIYAYLSSIEKEKSANELIRQLYVAATRARKHLHLLGYCSSRGTPAPGSLLAILWNGLDPHEQRRFVDAATQPAPEPGDAPRQQAPLLRLPIDWSPPAPVQPIVWNGSAAEVSPDPHPTFDWVSDNLRHAGTVVHQILQRIARDPEYRPSPASIRISLAQLGVPPAGLDATRRRVGQAIHRILSSERGRWILAPHRDSRCELPVAALIDGRIFRGTIDRTFIDGEGVRWIVDFKTSGHEGGALSSFLDEQQRRYRPQLERYGRMFLSQPHPVRLGLYFPLLDEWREWPLL